MNVALNTYQISKAQSFLSRYGKSVDCNFSEEGVELLMLQHEDFSVRILFDECSEPLITLSDKRKEFNPMSFLSDSYQTRGDVQAVIEDWIESTF